MKPIIMSKKICAVLLLVLWHSTALGQVERREQGNLRIEGIPEVPHAFAERVQQYQNTRSARLYGWMPDGSGLLIGTRFGETQQLHVVEHAGGARQQITFFEEPVVGATISPDPSINGLTFLRDSGGSEFYQIFFYDLKTREYRQLTDGSSRNDDVVWGNSGDRFVYSTTQRNGRDFDLHIMYLDGTSVPVLEEGGLWYATDWSPDDSKLLVTRAVSVNESYPYILDVATGELALLRGTDSKTAFGDALFNADGTGVYFVSDEDSQFGRLRFLHLTTGEVNVLTPDIDWDVEQLELSPDGRFLAIAVNEQGYSRLYLLDTETSQRRTVELPVGLIGGLKFSPDARRLGLHFNTPQSPGDVFSLDLMTDELTRWTHSEIGGLDSESFVEPELIRFQTFDGRMIPAFYYKPEGSGPYPVVIHIHGGPESQRRPTFGSLTQFFLNELGIAVLAPNVRGSTGYGKDYVLLDNEMKREDAVKDIGALLDWIGSQPELESARVAVVGGSYGGYMVLASLAHYNDRLQAGINGFGISNFVTFLENTEDYRRDLRRAEYGDERDPEMREFLHRISPTTNADKIDSPVFVVQGLNDPRVPVSESEQIVAQIRENGGRVWYLLATDEGHGFSKKSNRDYFMEASAYFLKTHLTGDTEVKEIE